MKVFEKVSNLVLTLELMLVAVRCLKSADPPESGVPELFCADLQLLFGVAFSVPTIAFRSVLGLFEFPLDVARFEALSFPSFSRSRQSSWKSIGQQTAVED
jgi:hypothetical protein